MERQAQIDHMSETGKTQRSHRSEGLYKTCVSARSQERLRHVLLHLKSGFEDESYRGSGAISKLLSMDRRFQAMAKSLQEKDHEVRPTRSGHWRSCTR